uniref:SP-RING-type domain-containing protein n=1 Tax=Caenorhabditis tropicalis TaxID=1561998 RepID=A0A1I7UNA4_9PELO
MWAPQGVPMSQPGSSAGHMPPGASGGAAPYPGQMNPMQHPGMGGYPGGQMQLPYGQMEGNHAMYDHRMMAANRAAAAAAGRPQGMMPDYPQMPMGHNPQNGMMRMPVQYPPGHPQMQYGQMMRAPPVSVYGQMNHVQQYAVTAHPNPTQLSVIHPDVRALYDSSFGYKIERDLLTEGMIATGTFGCEAQITPDAFDFLEQNPHSDVILSVWKSLKEGNEADCQLEVFVNGQLIMNQLSDNKSVSIKQYVRSGVNIINVGYSAPVAMHSMACEFVMRKNVGELKRLIQSKRSPQDQNMIANQQRMTLMQQANKRQAGTVSTTLNCVISKKRMFTPARHNDCKKFVFDLAQMITSSKHKTRYHCNHCNQYFKLEDINIDYFLLHAVVNFPLGINDVIVDKSGQIRPGEHEDQKPKRGKKKNENADVNGGHTIKRIKSEIIVKQEPGMYDMHGRNVPFSPMPMPGSVPPDWTRLQSPPFSMQSPNKIQLGPATPATPGMIFQNPASAGSMLNMSSPRQMPGLGHPLMPPHDPMLAVRSGSAPYTPESVKNDKNDELLMNIEGLYISRSNCIEPALIIDYMDGTKDDNFEDNLIYEMPSSPKHQQQLLDGAQTLMAPGSTSSSNASTFTPPFDDIHLGNRPSH